MKHLSVPILAVLLTPGVTLWRADAASAEGTELVVMNLAAHPDDEDGRTLAYYRWAKDARAYSVIYTRGEGGQNEIGPELYEELAAIRTLETERAARILGTQVYYLNFPDFGYSRTAEETFEWWGGRDTVTARITYLIRKLKPDVLFTNHDTTTVGPARQHGHHQAVGISVYDAFALASDPSYHPEQLEEEGVDLWQPKRLFLRHWNRPESFSTAVPVGDELDEGRSYADLAAAALREHESQGMSTFAGRFSTPATYFTLLRQAGNSPLDAGDLAGHLPLDVKPTPSLRYLIDSRRLPELGSGAISLSDSIVVPGARVELDFDRARLPSLPLRLRFQGAVDTTILLVEGLRQGTSLRIPNNAGPTYPAVAYQYDRLLGGPPIVFSVEEVSTGRRLAGGYLPVEIAPRFLLDSPLPVVRVLRDGAEVPYEVTLWDDQIDQITVRAAVSSSTNSRVLGHEYSTLNASDSRKLQGTIDVRLSQDATPGAYVISLTAVAETAGASLRPAHLFLTGRAFDVLVAENVRVGIVESYDNSLAAALNELGVEHVLLDSSALAAGSLDHLHTILVDIRAYLVRADLRRHNDRLLDWVRRGGNLIVNYQKTFEWNEGEADPFVPGRTNDKGFAPYPIRLGRGRVTREDAPVTLLQPAHPFFHTPNRIEDDDWNGWVQERGLYFPQQYDDRYLELFSLHDPGEEPLRGSTLFANYGEGTYVYTALAWYRQLKELHPGAFKVFANMISLPLVSEEHVGAAATGAR